MSAPRTARVRREERRAASAGNLSHALSASDVPVREAAALVGVDEKLVRRWCDPHEGQSISVADLAALPESVRVEVVRADLLPGHVVVRAPSGAGSLECDLRHAAAAARDAADAAATAMEAWADGHMTRSEAEPVIARCDAVIERFYAMRERASLAMREGVIAKGGGSLKALAGGRS